jgi:predicted transcriptional regulator
MIAAFSHHGLRTSELNLELELTSKQLYMRISYLRKAGLVRRQSGRYFLSSYGKVIRAYLDIMNDPSTNYEKLAAVDSIENITYC